MHLDTILGLIIDREAAAAHRAGQLHAQISALTEELTLLDGELADLATTRSTLRTLTADEFTAEDPTVPSSAYQQILGVLRTTPDGMRAKDICLALNIEPLPKHVEGARAKLKRMVNRQILTESQPGIFALAPNGLNLPDRPLRPVCLPVRASNRGDQERCAQGRAPDHPAPVLCLRFQKAWR
jgi:hypothetical protein